MPLYRVYTIVAEHTVTLPGIRPEGTFRFRVWRREDIDNKWSGNVEIPPRMLVYDGDSRDDMLQKAKEDLSKRYPGATFSWENTSDFS